MMSLETIKAVIIDDDEFIHHQLKLELSQHCPEVHVAACAENAPQGLAIIEATRPDVVFLDIQMPEVNGFELLNQFENPGFSVIFITSYNQYAIQALRYSALDYLLKPINPEELKAALLRYRKKQSPVQLRLQMDSLRHNLSKNNGDFRLVVTSRADEVSFAVGRILWCEGDSNYTHFHLDEGRKVTASKTLKEFEEILSDKEFIRVHKSHLVNVSHVERLTPAGQLIMSNKKVLEVAKRRLKDVRMQLDMRNA